MRYLVTYYNGVGSREKFFTDKDKAFKFRASCGDLTAIVWKEQ